MEVELNEKLARWAGFKKNVMGHRRPDGRYASLWHYPDGLDYAAVPDFANDISACFKWLVPKVISMGLRCEWGTASKVNSFSIHDEWGRLYAAAHCDRGKGELDALALCRAIEQMIELEVK